MSELTKILGVAINTLLINHDIDTSIIKTEEVDFTIEKIKSKIIDLLPKEKVGDTMREDYTGNCDDDYDKGVSNGEQWGFNACLADIKHKLEEK